MQSYIEPDFTFLKESLLNLNNEYKNEKNTKRLQLIKWLISLTRVSEKKVLLGAVTYALESINNEYYLRAPNVISLGTFTIGSDLYKLLRKAMQINQRNILEDQTRLIYLINLLHSKVIQENNLESDLKKIIRSVIKRLKFSIDLLLKRPPTEKNLQQSFGSLPLKYQESLQKRMQGISYHLGITGPSKSRLRYLQLLEILKLELRGVDLQSDEVVSKNYLIKYGALLYLMVQIENEYSVRNPSTSTLYVACSQALNIGNSNELSNLQKKVFLSGFLNYLSPVLLDNKKILAWQKKGITAEYIKKLQDNLIATLQTFNNAADNGYTSTRINNYLNTLSSYAANYGVSLLIANSVRYIARNNLNSGIISTILTPEYALIMTLILLLKKSAEANVISRTARAIEPLIRVLIKMPINFTCKHFDSLQYLIVNLEQTKLLAENPTNNAAFILALLDTPEDIFSSEQKEILRRVIDYDTIIHAYHPEPYIEEKQPEGITLPTAPLMEPGNKSANP